MVRETSSALFSRNCPNLRMLFSSFSTPPPSRQNGTLSEHHLQNRKIRPVYSVQSCPSFAMATEYVRLARGEFDLQNMLPVFAPGSRGLRSARLHPQDMITSCKHHWGLAARRRSQMSLAKQWMELATVLLMPLSTTPPKCETFSLLQCAAAGADGYLLSVRIDDLGSS